MWKVARLAEELAATQERLCTIELVSIWVLCYCVKISQVEFKTTAAGINTKSENFLFNFMFKRDDKTQVLLSVFYLHRHGVHLAMKLPNQEFRMHQKKSLVW
jgi:hypothetical protein